MNILTADISQEIGSEEMDVKNKIKVQKLLTIVLAWQVIAVLLAVYDHLALFSSYSLGKTEIYTFWFNLRFHMMAALMGSLLGGYYLVYYMGDRARHRSYGRNIIMVCVAYVVIVTFITIVLSAYFALAVVGKPLNHPQTIEFYSQSLFNPFHLKNIVFWAVVVALTQFFLQLNDKFGPGILWAFIRGKYHQPREEVRIFMFLDLKSSTSIAEKLGNEKYHNLLKDFYSDITNSILYHKGEIYQYVGDEVVVSWKMSNGLEDHNCLKCFFDMRKKITDLREKYVAKYQIAPDFKAGVHYGKVIAGEIGIIKRDITFSGDVLNTTARLQSECNNFNVNLLISDELLDALKPDDDYELSSLGSIQLRGKEQKVEVSTARMVPF